MATKFANAEYETCLMTPSWRLQFLGDSSGVFF